MILEPVCNISQSNNVHQNFKETLVFNNFQGFVLKRFQNGSKNLINLQSRISIKNLKSGFNSHISVIHSIFSVVLLWQAGKYIFMYLLSMCNQKGIVFRILYVTILLSNAVLIFLVSFQYLVVIGKKYTVLNYYFIYSLFNLSNIQFLLVNIYSLNAVDVYLCLMSQISAS